MNNNTSVQLENPTPKQEQNTWPLSDRLAWALGLPVRPSTKLVAVCIAQHAGSTTGMAWPSIATIAATTGLSRRQVVYAIHELEAGEHLAVTRLKIGKKNASNRYRLPRMGSAQVAPGGSAQVAPPSAQVAPGGSAQVAPDPVSKEPVKEPKLLQPRARDFTKATKATEGEPGRNSCACGNTWPAKCGTNCYKCQKQKMTQAPQKTQEPAPARDELPDSIFVCAGALQCKICANRWPESFGAVCLACKTPAGSMKALMWKRGIRE